jgi:hypothetical protein
MHDPNHPAVDAYYKSLGRFVHEFGHTEHHLAFMIHRYASGVINEAYEPIFAPGRGAIRPHPVMDILRALMGDQRSGVLVEIAKELMRAAGRDEQSRKEMKDTVDHLGSITAIRNRIIHHGAWLEDDESRWRSSTAPQGRAPKDLKTAFFTVDDLGNASTDLHVIRERISALLVTENPHLRPEAEKAGYFRPKPWLYKPVQLDAKGR